LSNEKGNWLWQIVKNELKLENEPNNWEIKSRSPKLKESILFMMIKCKSITKGFDYNHLNCHRCTLMPKIYVTAPFSGNINSLRVREQSGLSDSVFKTDFLWQKECLFKKNYT
jgi:hypothetical protein